MSTTIIALAVIFVVVAIFAPSVFDSFFSAIDHANGLYTATNLLPRVGQDEILCDLRVKVNAELVQGVGLFGVGDQPYVEIKSFTADNYDWFECHATSTISALDLADFDVPVPIKVDELDFITIGEEKTHSEIVLRDSSDSTQKVDAFTQPQLFRDIQISSGAGVVSTPLDMSVEFVVKNIPARDYTLEIYYGRIINDLPAGEPFLTTIKGLD